MGLGKRERESPSDLVTYSSSVQKAKQYHRNLFYDSRLRVYCNMDYQHETISEGGVRTNHAWAFSCLKCPSKNHCLQSHRLSHFG